MAKGQNFERTFCKKLSLWFTFGKHEDAFWRTSGSGARATTRMKQGKKTADSYGDVRAERRAGKPLTKKTFIELKRGYTGKKGKKSTRYISILDLIDTENVEKLKKKPVLIQWWEEAEVKRKEAGRKRTFIIFRRDYKVGCILMSNKTFQGLKEKNGTMVCPPYHGCIGLNVFGKLFMVLRIEDFFKWCDPTTLGAIRVRQIKRRKTKRKIKRRQHGTHKRVKLIRRHIERSKRND